MSRPHWHPNDRFITVIKGTWWVGTGEPFDPDTTIPVPAGSYVTHFGKEIHYDGAKDGEVWSADRRRRPGDQHAGLDAAARALGAIAQ